MDNKGDGRVVAHLESGKRVTGDAMLYAMGRLGNTDSLNLQVGRGGGGGGRGVQCSRRDDASNRRHLGPCHKSPAKEASSQAGLAAGLEVEGNVIRSLGVGAWGGCPSLA